MNRASTIRIGISSCLLGEPVRYDGGHKRNDDILKAFGRRFTFVPVCPEVEAGMGVPRETLRLIGAPASPRLVTTQTGVDHTDRLLTFARERVRQLEALDLSGYIFKSRSPSCGVEGVEVYSGGEEPSQEGRGLFARVLTEHFPGMPVAEERRLSDSALREAFIERVLRFHKSKRKE